MKRRPVPMPEPDYVNGRSTKDNLEAAGLTKRKASCRTWDLLRGGEVVLAGASLVEINKWLRAAT